MENQPGNGTDSASKAEQFKVNYFHEFRNGKRSLWWIVFASLVVATLATRTVSLDYPDQVCWDEVHFGKFASWYIQRSFFFDVHPPLGKMLIALFGYLDGYNGTFAFEKPGDKFHDHRFLGMRMGCALMGAMLVPFSFLTVWEMTYSLPAATLAALLLLFDHGMVTLNRYILLDPLLLFFISAAVYTSVKFHNQRDDAFSPKWWFWLSAVGFALTGSISVKFVGLFVVLLVGLRVVVDLWEILGDLSRPVVYTVKHFLARVLCLIVLPIVLYVIFFYIHLSLLKFTGNGDATFSSAFQVSLEGNPLHNATAPRDVAYGAILRLKNSILGGNYLHSHFHLYPVGVGARHQQITTYGLRDGNNYWIIKRADQEAPEWNSRPEIDYVRNGDLIRLEHRPTQRNLHSHRKPAPMSRRHFQVTGYGQNGTGDDNDLWRLVIEKGRKGEILQTIRHQFKLVHHLENCVLTTTKKNLPKWGFDQQEVTCNPNLRDPLAFWNIEHNMHPGLPNVSYSEFSLNFIQRFMEYHSVMFSSNSGFKPKPGEPTSRPWMWPIDYQGQYFSFENVRIYLLGNPIIWWSNLLFMAVFLVLYAVTKLRNKRGIVSSSAQLVLQKRTLHSCGWLFVGWLLHYVPFWAMGRILYYHHYFPALLFSSMLTGVVLDYLMETIYLWMPHRLSDQLTYLFFGIIVGGLAYSFYLFAPLSYGMTGNLSSETNSTMYGLRWLSSWEF